VIAGTVLATVGGVAGLIAILAVLMAIDSRDDLEALFSAALMSFPAALTSIWFTGLAAMVFAAGKAWRRAAALAIVTALSIAATSWWWWPHTS
jgi:hypothetical protein